MTVAVALFYVVYLLYVAALLTDLIRLGATQQPSARIARWTVSVGFFIHTVFVIDWLIVMGVEAIVGPLGLLAGITWGMVAMMLLVRFRFKLVMHEPAVLAVVCALLTLGHALPTPQPSDLRPEYVQGIGLFLFPTHIIACYLGYAAFANAFAVSANYLVLDFALKNRRVSLLEHSAASLTDLDRANVWLIAAGVLGLLAGVLIGVAWMVVAHGITHELGKLVVTAFILLLYSALLLVRWRRLLLGKRMAWASVAALSIVLISFGFVR